MKNLLMAMMLLMTNVTYAISDGEKLCRGEFSERILESAKACSEEDLAGATVAVYRLERELTSVQQQLQRVEAYQTGGNYDNDKKRENTILVSGAVLSLIGGLPAVFSTNTTVKVAGFVTWVIGFAMTYGYSKMRAPIVKYNVDDVPKLKAQVGMILEQIRIRKALLEAASQLKAAGRE